MAAGVSGPTRSQKVFRMHKLYGCQKRRAQKEKNTGKGTGNNERPFIVSLPLQYVPLEKIDLCATSHV